MPATPMETATQPANKPWSPNWPDSLVFACCLLSIGLGFIESRLNTDDLHWGLMYGNAADMLAGLTPYREIFIQYGWLTTKIQSIGLLLFGNTVSSVGITTSLFYAANIYLSYRLWNKILSRGLACASAVLMFLIQGYIIFPWSNYFSYTFFLASLLWMTAGRSSGRNYFLAGLFAGLSLLARQSPLPVLVPIYMHGLWMLINNPEQRSRRTILGNFGYFHIGLSLVWAVFLVHLMQQAAIHEWYQQTFTISKFYKEYFQAKNKDLFPKDNIAIALFINLISNIARRLLQLSNIRYTIYSLAFVNSLIIWIQTADARQAARQIEYNKKTNLLFLYSSVVLLGSLNSMHIYEIFRLQNASSLGLGLLVYSLNNLAIRFGNWRKPLLLITALATFTALSSGVVIINDGHPKEIRNGYLYHPWNRNTLFRQTIDKPGFPPILSDKWQDGRTNAFYLDLTQTLDRYASCGLTNLINLTDNGVIPYLTDSLQTFQRSPVHYQALQNLIFNDEKERIAEHIRKGDSVLALAVAPKRKRAVPVPDHYTVVFRASPTSNSSSLVTGNNFVIAVPRDLACPTGRPPG
ncbi:MAG: hypothetical protein ACK5UG_06525 [Synechococcaceae cyanobacterium]|jgi:hypothetical protein